MRNLTYILGLSLVSLSLLACGGNEAEDTGADMNESESTGDGDGDPETGDGDGDLETGDGDGDPTTGDGDGDPTTGDGDGDPTTGDGDGDGDPTTGDGDGDGDPEPGVCAQGCEEDADCCPQGSLGCPSDEYPNNYTCNEGVCEFGGCSSNEDCQAGGLQPNNECHPVNQFPTCFTVCESDLDCILLPGTTCSGVADDSTTYCAGEPVPPCESDDDCGGNGVCDVETGECGCLEDADCDTEAANVCVLG